jgi:hypothetical protein
MLRAQADWTFILPLELPVKVLRLLAASRTEKSDKPAEAFFSARGTALS